MKILIFGGCHIYAFGIENIEDGYLQRYLANLETEYGKLEVTSYAPIWAKNINPLLRNQEVNLRDYDLIILQLGNTDFDVRMSELYNLFRINNRNLSLDKSVFAKPLNMKTVEERRGWYKKQEKHSLFTGFLKNYLSYALIPIVDIYDKLIGIPKLSFHEKHFNELFSYLEPVSNKVICISPFPQFFRFSHYFRKYAAEIIRKNCEKYKIVYLDLLENEKFKNQKYFLKDLVHLHKNGHDAFYEMLIDITKSYFSKY